MAKVLEALDDDEAALWAIISDPSGVDLAEFIWTDDEQDDGCFRLWDFQYKWFRNQDPLQIDCSARSIGKTTSIIVRLFSFVFLNPGEQAVVTGPELIHVKPICQLVERKFTSTRIGKSMLLSGARNGIIAWPFTLRTRNGARINGLIPQRDGRGVKGSHPMHLELDEAQDYSDAAWTELFETLKRGHANSQWRCHGVTRGVRDQFYKFTQPHSGWTVHRFTAMSRPTWNDTERQEKIEMYGSKQAPDYRRNILGFHGDAVSPLFPLYALLGCHPAGTAVWTRDSVTGMELPILIEDLEQGDEVLNATGTGKIKKIATSEHDTLIRLGIDGPNGRDEIYVTPEHPYLTDRGWIQVGELRCGDRVATGQGLQELWQDLLHKGERLLFPGLLANKGGQSVQGGDSETGSDMRDVWWSNSGSREEVLFQKMSLGGRVDIGSRSSLQNLWWLGGVQQVVLQSDMHGTCTPQTGPLSRMPAVWGATHQTGSVEVLQHEMRLRRSREESHREEDLRGVWQGVRGNFTAQQAFLFTDVCRELAWEELSGFSNANWSDDETVRVLQRDFRALLVGQKVLLDQMREQCFEASSHEACGSSLSAMRKSISAKEHEQQVLFQCMRRVGQTDSQASDGSPLVASLSEGTWGFAVASIRALAEFRGERRSSGVATAVLDEPTGFRGTGQLFAGRYCLSSDEDCGGSRWKRTQSDCRDAIEGCDSRWLAAFARVDSIEVLQRGDREFDRLSNGKNTVTCYDLTVSVHPSFQIGNNRLVVHNCVDQDEMSEYNVEQYYSIRITGEQLETDQLPIASFLDFPKIHKMNWKRFWIGADLGFTQHPSEIAVFGENPDKQRGSVLTLLSRVHLERVRHKDQAEALLHCLMWYDAAALGLDKNGVGLPLFQDIQDRAPDYAKRIKGYSYSEKLLAEIDQTIEVDEHDDPVEKAGIMKNALELASDELRDLVFAKRILLPWDKEIIGEYQGQTYQVIKDSLNIYGKKVFNRGTFHFLDACKNMVLCWRQERIDTLVEVNKKTFEPVVPIFL